MGLTPAYTFWGDFATDLCLGNALAYRVPGRQKIVRLRTYSAVVNRERGAYIYQVEPITPGPENMMSLGSGA